MLKKLGYVGTTALVGVSTLFVGKSSRVSAEEGDLDGIEGYDAVEGQVNDGVTSVPSTGGAESDAGSAGNFFKGWNPVTDDQMAKGSAFAQPVVNLLGNFVGFGLTIVVGWLGVQTVIDLIYWGIPPLRGLLAKQNSTDQQPSMGGMGMGMGGSQPQQQSSSKLPVFVSDDMLQSMEAGGNVSSQGGMNGGMAGGMGMGGMRGGMGMGMGGMQQQQEPPKRKNILVSYAKKRLLSLVILGVCITVLFSSILLDTGINLGAFVVKIIEFLNGVVVSNT